MIRHLINALSFLSCLVSFTAFGQSSDTREILLKIHKETDARRDSIAKAYTSLRDSIQITVDSITKYKLSKTIDTLDKIFEENNKQELLIEFQFCP